jgi:hypothetical protein
VTRSGFDSYGLIGGGAGLADQVIAVRVLDIDADKLKEAVGGMSGSAAALALSLVDKAPKAALDAAKPLIVSKAKDYGVTLEIGVSNKPASEPRALSEFWPGLAAGGVIGFSVFGIVKLIGRLLGRS